MSMSVPPLGPHGGDGERIARALGLDPESLLDLSASLNPVAPDVMTLAATHLGSPRHYPHAGPSGVGPGHRHRAGAPAPDQRGSGGHLPGRAADRGQGRGAGVLPPSP